MSALLIILLTLGALIILLASLGWIAASRRAGAGEEELLRELARAQRALSQAQALDRGWDRTVMDAAAGRAAAQRLGDGAFSKPQLVEVIDKPGKDEDQAVYRVETPDGDAHRITLGRSGDVWGPA